MTVESSSLVEEINVLLAAPPASDREPYLHRLEDVLTAGYAHALALEAERWRLERQIGEVASRLAYEGDTAAADDLASLARRMSDTDVEVVRLRTALASLRDRASEARSAA